MLWKRNRFTDVEKKLCYQGEGNGRGKDWEFGIVRGKLLYIGSINNKVLLHSTGKYIQYSITNHMEKEKNCWAGKDFKTISCRVVTPFQRYTDEGSRKHTCLIIRLIGGKAWNQTLFFQFRCPLQWFIKFLTSCSIIHF